MTPEQIDRVFGRGRLKMVTGEHVEVFREAVAPGERRRYTKRFLNTPDGDFGQWTEREWRILARLIGHGITCVPEVVHFDRGRVDGAQIVQTYDAGATVDQWATLLPVTRDGRVYRHVFEDCAHWWALAHHCLLAVNAIHPLELVHLDIKGDNVCIPYAPASFDPDTADLALRPVFGELALIDFAFALISRASLTTALPIGWQKDYDYQSPRLLAALEAGRSGDLKLTRDLDWRCDLYSLAAMLKRYLPNESAVMQPPLGAAWTRDRYDAAKALILRIRELHDAELPSQRPHAELIELTGARVSDPELAHSLERGWNLARGVSGSPTAASPLTPVTRLAPSMRVTRSGRSTAVTVVAPQIESVSRAPGNAPIPLHNEVLSPQARGRGRRIAIAALFAFAAIGAALLWGVDRLQEGDGSDDMVKTIAAAGDAESATEPLLAQQATSQSPPAPTPAPAAGSAPRESPAATSPTPTTQDVAESPPSETIDASAQAAPATQSPAEPAAAPPGQRRGAQARGPASDAQMSSGRALPRQPSAPSRSATKLAHVPPIIAQTEPRGAQARPPTQATAPAAVPAPVPAPRVYAPWASLEPPAWARSNYRGKGPGVPPGANSVEASAKVASSAGPSSLESAAAAAIPARAASAATEASRPQPSLVASAATDAPRMPSVVTTPLAQPSMMSPATSSERGAAPDAMQQQAARGVRPAAPIEERSVPARVASAEVAPIVVESRNRTAPAEQAPALDFLAQGRRMLASDVPRIAARAEPQVARILRLAAAAYYQADERVVAESTRAARVDDAAFFMRPIFPGEARRLNDEARAVLGSRRNVMEAFEFQLRALGANPRDPEIAGNLASLYLKLTPSQPDVARQLALVALAGRDPQYQSSRLEDWFTFAVASALVGRESDATNALYVTLALTGDVDRRCVAAMTALANYGRPLRRPVEAMYYRLHAQGRGIDSQACAWPPNGSFMSRLQ